LGTKIYNSIFAITNDLICEKLAHYDYEVSLPNKIIKILSRNKNNTYLAGSDRYHTFGGL